MVSQMYRFIPTLQAGLPVFPDGIPSAAGRRQALPFSPGDLAAARRALGCHRTQFTEQAMSESFAVLEHWWQGRVSFQEWRGKRRSESLF